MLSFGKISKGLHGLKVNQRSCRAITSLNNNNMVGGNTEQNTIENRFFTGNSNQDEFPTLKNGVKLPMLLEVSG